MESSSLSPWLLLSEGVYTVKNEVMVDHVVIGLFKVVKTSEEVVG